MNLRRNLKPLSLLVLIVIIFPAYNFYNAVNASTAANEIGDSNFAAADQEQVKLFGYVRDIYGEPMASANIHVTDRNQSTMGDAQTDLDGYYEIVAFYRELYYFGIHTQVSQDNPHLLSYIPITETVLSGQSSEVRTDFNLRPGGNILINAYDNDGVFLRNRDFRELTNNHAYATDLDSIPNYGTFDADYDDQSEWNWDLAIPALIVPANEKCSIHILWAVPGFGKIAITADNESKGYSVDQSDKFVLNFNYEAAKSKLSSFQRDITSLEAQGYDISASVRTMFELSQSRLKTAENYLATADMKNAVSELNLSLNQSFWGQEQLILEKSQVDIEKNRKNDVDLTIVDQEGNPLENCFVSYSQINHDFFFGVTPVGDTYNEQVTQLLIQAGINFEDVTFTWKDVEPTRGEFIWTSIDQHQKIDQQAQQDFTLLGGMILWFLRDSNMPEADLEFPYYLDSLNFDELNSAIYDHVYQISSRYSDQIEYYQLLHEPNQQNALNLTWHEKLELYKTAIQAMHDGDPDGKVFYTSTDLPYEYGATKFGNANDLANVVISSPEFLQLLADEGIEVDVVGIETYHAGNVQVHGPLLGLDMVTLSSLFDQYSEFQKPVFAGEFSAPSTMEEGSGWWHQYWDEQTQAEYVKDFYTIAFSKPLVNGVMWSYGVSDRDSYVINGGLLDSDLNPKPAYFALKDLVNAWTTSGSGHTDVNGSIEFRGFAGEYTINVTTPSGSSVQNVHVYENSTNIFTLTLTNQSSLQPVPTPTPTQTPIPTKHPSSEPTSTPTPTPTVSPSPAIPEFTAWMTLSLLLASALLLTIYKKKRKTSF